MISGIRFSVQKARTSSSVRFWFMMDSHWLTRMVKDIGLQLMTKKITGYAGILWTSWQWYPSKGYNAYATGSVTHFDAAKLLEDYGNSVYTHEMTHNSDGAIYFEGYGRREGWVRNSMLGDSCNLHRAQMNQLLRSILSSRWTRILRHVCIPIISRTCSKCSRPATLCPWYVWHDLHLGLSRRYFMLKQSDAAKLQWFRKMENYYITDKYGKGDPRWKPDAKLYSWGNQAAEDLWLPDWKWCDHS